MWGGGGVGDSKCNCVKAAGNHLRKKSVANLTKLKETTQSARKKGKKTKNKFHRRRKVSFTKREGGE